MKDFTAEPTTEVELSAQDLLELSPSRAIEHPEHCAERQTLEQRAVEVVTTIAQPVQTRDAPSSANRRMSVSRVVLALSFAVAAVTVIGARYEYSAPERPIQSSLRIATQEATAFEKPELTTDLERPPILFTNPFDNSEVFEFPPGTSEAEVRAVVADLLIKRAIERQDQIDARPPQRR